MLILKRRIGQKIIINNNITLFISGHEGSSMRIIIDAPKEIPIHREEIYKKLKNNNEQFVRKGIK